MSRLQTIVPHPSTTATPSSRKVAISSFLQDPESVAYLARLGETMGAEVIFLSPKKHALQCDQTGPSLINADGTAVKLDALLTDKGHVSFKGPIIQALKRAGKPVINSFQSIENARNKEHTHALLSAHGIPTPKTWFIQDKATLGQTMKLNPAQHWVLKGTTGTFSDQVFLVKSSTEAIELAQKLWANKSNVILQEYIPECYGQSLRVVVFDGKPLVTYLRKSEGDFRSNADYPGEKNRVFSPPITELETVKALAVASAKALGLTFAGVDLILSNRGPLVLEVNASPNSPIPTVDGVDIYRHHLGYLMRKLDKTV